MASERALKRTIVAWLRERQILVIPQPASAMGIAGRPDLICVLPGGRVLAIEVKSPGGRLTPAQKAMLERIRELGGVAIVARSLQDVTEVVLALEAKGWTASA